MTAAKRSAERPNAADGFTPLQSTSHDVSDFLYASQADLSGPHSMALLQYAAHLYMSHIFVLSLVSVPIFFAANSIFFFLSEEHSLVSPPMTSQPMVHLHASSALSSPHSARRRGSSSAVAVATKAKSATSCVSAMTVIPEERL